MGLACGHLTPGWEKIINVGYSAIRRQAQEWMDAHEGSLMGNDMSKYMFYKSATIVCDGASTLIKRYAVLASEKAAETNDKKRKAEFEEMAASLEWIAEKPARSFREAMQAALLYQILLSYEAPIPAPAFGRFDQYTWPFLKKRPEGRQTYIG